MLDFASKARNLAQLEGRLGNAQVLPQLRFDRQSWSCSGAALIDRCDRDWIRQPVIVRSSSVAEDSAFESLAGRFTSVSNISGPEQIARAVDEVFASYDTNDYNDECFIQPMLVDVSVAGVAFTRDPATHGHYVVISYDDESGTTDRVTNGSSNALKTTVVHKSKLTDEPPNANDWQAILLGVLKELESLFRHDALDVEFAVDKDQRVYVLQVRPLALQARAGSLSATSHEKALSEIEALLDTRSQPHPYLYGRRSIFGNMPDWNPAEIIGSRPQPLALSLYRELVTDSIWAYQRHNYGYKNLRSFPLLLSLHGMPYIDVRVSFNSFIPAIIDADLAEKLVNYYLERLIEHPACHDKIEFEIIFSCYTLDLPQRLSKLSAFGFENDEQDTLANALRGLTNTIIHPEEGLWRRDLEKIERLEERQRELFGAGLNKSDEIYWILEDCKRYGTLPFAGLARAAFIAVQLLRSLTTTGILSAADYERFMASLHTVSGDVAVGFENLSSTDFLERFGHLRPGSYDIRLPRYDQDSERYFNWDAPRKSQVGSEHDTFQLSLPQLKALDRLLGEHGIEHDVITFFDFIKQAIEGREQAKFVFTRSLSYALKSIEQWGQDFGFDRHDLAFADYQDIKELYAGAADAQAVLGGSIDRGQARYETTECLLLPSLIVDPRDVWRFELAGDEPNFITLKSYEGGVVLDLEHKDSLSGAVVMIPAADPGYDWIFLHDIGALITQYGGANSHMAIRAGELGIPAVIGCGESYFQQWSKATILRVDCANQHVRRIR